MARGEQKIIDASTAGSGSVTFTTHHSGQVAVTITCGDTSANFAIYAKATSTATDSKVFSTFSATPSTAAITGNTSATAAVAYSNAQLSTAYGDASAGVSITLDGSMYSYSVKWNSNTDTVNAWAYVGDSA
jgi:hypothetical protein